MMSDRFSVQLRQHLVDPANERPAEGQLAAIVGHVAVTSQRRPLSAWLLGLRVRIGRLPIAVRYALIAVALVLAAVAGALLAGGAARPSTPFEGTWTTIDVPDGSTMNLYVGAGERPRVRFEDLFANGAACVEAESKIFTADGVGEISGDRLDATFPNGGGCGLETVAVAGTFVYHPDADALVDQDGLVWTRVTGIKAPSPTLGAEPSSIAETPFEGRWTATDPGDASTLTLIVGAGTAPVVQFQDDLATGGVCDADTVKVFRADGIGEVLSTRLVVTYPDGGGCGRNVVPIGGVYDYQAATDTLRDADFVIWARVSPAGEPAATLRPIATRPAPTLLGGCIDLRQGGTYTARDLSGSMSLTVTVPGAPVVPWYGSRDVFEMAGSCQDGSPIAFHASGATIVNDTSCMPGSANITDFADAVARLDAPRGNDISDRIDLTIDGHPAARYDISKLSTCPGFGLWSGTIIGEGETGSIYVIDVDGVLIEIELNRNGSQTAAELEETYAIIASMQFR